MTKKPIISDEFSRRFGDLLKFDEALNELDKEPLDLENDTELLINMLKSDIIIYEAEIKLYKKVMFEMSRALKCSKCPFKEADCTETGYCWEMFFNRFSQYTCQKCVEQNICPYAFDIYNINGDCLAGK